MDVRYSRMFLLQTVRVTVGATKCRSERNRSIPTKTIITTMIRWTRGIILRTKRRSCRPDSWARLCASTWILANRYPVRINKLTSHAKLSLCEPFVGSTDRFRSTQHHLGFSPSVYIVYTVSAIHSCLSPSFYLASPHSRSSCCSSPNISSFDIEWTRRVKKSANRVFTREGNKRRKGTTPETRIHRWTREGLVRE